MWPLKLLLHLFWEENGWRQGNSWHWMVQKAIHQKEKSPALHDKQGSSVKENFQDMTGQELSHESHIWEVAQ